MFAAIRKSILARIVTGVLITCVGAHTGVRVHDGSPESCVPQIIGSVEKNTMKKNKK
jgi:hypothetical protein